jgi:opacity protein-like surface antigen
MRFIAVFAIAGLACVPAASAQTAPVAAPPDHGYVEGVLQSAFGNVTSQSYGVELGVSLMPNVQVFGEGGMVRDVATSEIGAAAQAIAGYLSQTQTNVQFRVKQPVTFGVAGLKYVVPTASSLRPYVIGGGGIARVKQDVTFTVGGSDVTPNLASQFGVQLGTDLSGTFTKPTIVAGAGLMWPAWQRLVIDVQYRYNHIFAEGSAITVNRAGVGIGVRF